MKNHKGQTLMEIVFAVGVLALIGIGIVSLSTSAVRNNDFSETNTEANKFLQEGTEWVEQLKTDSWQNIWPHSGGGAQGKHYCISDFQSNWSQEAKTNIPYYCDTPPATPQYIPGTTYYRNMHLVRVDLDGDALNGNESIKVNMNIVWDDSKGTHSVGTTTYLTDWEDL